MHVPELVRMGANIRIEGPRGDHRRTCESDGAQVMASDLRASASLVLAALVARGETSSTVSTTSIADTNASKRKLSGAWCVKSRRFDDNYEKTS